MGLLDIFKKKDINSEVHTSGEVNKYLAFVIAMINNLIDNQFSCDRRLLKDNGAIFYMNGKNGTKFDWQTNEHLSPFFVFYKDGNGAIKLVINKDGTAVAYYFLKGENNPCNTIQTEFSDKTAKDIAVLMYTISDCKGVFDTAITNLETTYNCTEFDNLEFEKNDM